MYIDGNPISGGGGGVRNTFRKIVVYGTSIEVTPSTQNSNNPCWPMRLAAALGLQYHVGTGAGTDLGVVNYGRGGGGVTWYGSSFPSSAKLNILDGFSCTQQEKQDMADSFVASGYMTSEEVESSKSSGAWNIGYEKSVLEEEDVDLYIFGTYGINDRQTWMKWTDTNGNEQTSFTVFGEPAGSAEPDPDLSFDRRTIYGAYNHVLRALYQQNPNAKVVILGQHTRQWSNLDIVNGVQRAVAEKWQIPFADWGNHLSLNDIWKGATKQDSTYSGDITMTLYQNDAVHLRKQGAELMGKWVAEWITKTELKPLNPRWTMA